MRKLLLLPFFVLFAVVYCGGNPPFGFPVPFYTYGNIGPQANVISNGFTFSRYSAIYDIFTPSNYDAVDGWFSLAFSPTDQVVNGGITPQNSFTSPRGDHVIITSSIPALYLNLFTVAATLRFDSQGWATILWEITNESPNALTDYVVTNNGNDDVGADDETDIFSTSSGDSTVDSNDDWAVVFDTSGSDLVVGFSFGRGGTPNFAQSQNSVDSFLWIRYLDFQPYETKNLLEVLAIGSHFPDYISIYDLRTMQYRLHSVLTYERNFYNYITADGYGLLDHLTYQQLFNAVNWNFLGAGVAGKLEADSESRVVRLDGSIEQITPEPGVYCLFEDRVLQVNFRFSSSGVVDEVVVFAREHGMSFHASLDLNSQPEFLVDGHSVEIPMSRFDGNLVTESAPFQVPFSHIPLSALAEYHVNSLHLRDIFTVVGGHHPDLGGFFNVAVHRRASENRFPGLLNVPHESKVRDVGLSSSVVPDIWVDLSQ